MFSTIAAMAHYYFIKQVWALWLSSQKQLKSALLKELDWSRLLLHCWSFNLTILSETDEGQELEVELECYCCKQQLKDSNLTFTLTLKVNTCWSAHGLKNKSLWTDKVNQTAQITVKSSNFHAFRSQCPHMLFIAHQCRKMKWSLS